MAGRSAQSWAAALRLLVLFAATWFAAPLEARADTCVEAYASRAPAAAAEALTCTRRHDETISTGHGPVRFIVWARAPLAANREIDVATVTDVVRRSIVAYDRIAPLPPTVMAIVGEEAASWSTGERREAHASADFQPDTHTCVIDFALAVTHEGVPGSRGAALQRQIGWNAAHETFHCVQAENFGARYRARHSDWWSEAQADYFPSYVFPDYLSDEFYDFDSESASRSLFDVSRGDDPNSSSGYANAVLMLYLERRSGIPYVLDAFRRTPADAGYREQAAQLAVFGEGAFAEQLHRFSQSFFSGSVRSALPNHPTIDTRPSFGAAIAVTSSVDLGFSPTRAELVPVTGDAAARRDYMHLYRGRLVLQPRHRYTVDAPGPGRITLMLEGYEYMDNPAGAVIDTCDEPVPGLAVADIVDPNEVFAPRLRIRAEAMASGVCGARDQCLVGRWSVDDAVMARITESLGAEADARIERGPMELAFTAAGVWRVAFNNLIVRWQPPAGQARIVFHGAGQGRWAAIDGLLQSSVTMDSSYQRLFVGRSPPANLRGVISRYGVPGGEVSYRCTPTTLTFSPPGATIVASGTKYCQQSRSGTSRSTS